MSNKIQPREYSKGGGGESIAHIRNSDGNLYVRYLKWNGDQWNWNDNWLDNDFNSDNPAIVRATLFISLPVFYWESFILFSFFQANRQAFFRSHILFPKDKCIFYHPKTWFPKGA